jgi:hypothetical protein
MLKIKHSGCFCIRTALRVTNAPGRRDKFQNSKRDRAIWHSLPVIVRT